MYRAIVRRQTTEMFARLGRGEWREVVGSPRHAADRRRVRRDGAAGIAEAAALPIV
jgi:hypothetical protein